MRQFKGVVRGVDGFARDRGGNFAVLFGAAASVLALAVGFAVNISQLYNAKSSLQGVVDAAVTSTARDLTLGVIKEADASTSVQAFLDANSAAGILQAGQIVLDKLTVDRTARTVQADVHADIGLYFPLFGTGGQQRVGASTTALYSNKTVEVAMMLDVTGSMAGQKIKDLRTAAGNAVDSFLTGQDLSNPRVRVSIVPYANSVNVGSLAASTVFVETKLSERKRPAMAVRNWRRRRRARTTAPPSARGPTNIRTPGRTSAWSTGTISCRALRNRPARPLAPRPRSSR